MRVFLPILLLLFLFTDNVTAQQRRRPVTVRATEIGQSAVVMDETLSVLRIKPSLFAAPIQRMRMGRKVSITDTAEADGVKFYRVNAMPSAAGWVQADAVFGKFRPDDESRLATLIQASNGFEQIEAATHFLKLYPMSKLRPSIMLLFGDLLEDAAAKLTRDASSRLVIREMAASGAPFHSYYLNYVGLDRYMRLGIRFLFNDLMKRYHYEGSSWREIITKFPSSKEITEAQKRLNSLKEKMALKPTK